MCEVAIVKETVYIKCNIYINDKSLFPAIPTSFPLRDRVPLFSYYSSFIFGYCCAIFNILCSCSSLIYNCFPAAP